MVIETTNYVKRLIEMIDKKRINTDVVGQHSNLSKYIAWYGGKTSWHKQTVLIKGEQRKKVIAQSGLGKLGTEEWAGMFLNEGLSISVPDEKGNDILQKILKENRLNNRLNHFGGKYFGLGYGQTLVMPSKINYLETKQLVKSNDVSVKIKFLDATRCYPITIDEDEVIECAIVKLSTNSITIQVHLLDENGCYVIGEISGKRNGDTFNLDSSTYKTWQTKSSVRLFQAWYPVNVDAENLDNPLGTSILTSTSVEWIKAFDLTFDKFITEFKNGGKRRYVSSELTYIDEEGNEVNVELADEDIYLPASKMGEAQNMVQEQSSQLRADAFIRGLQFFATMYGRSIGLGEDAFSIDSNGRPMQTATAAMLKKNEAFRNVQKNKNLAEANLIDMVMAIKEVYNNCVDNKLTYERDEVNVLFDDNIIEDTQALKDNDLKLVQANVMSIAEYRAKWFNEDDDDAKTFIYENALLLDKYLSALQSGALSPTMFVKLVFGDVLEEDEKQELIDYITEKMAAPTETPFNQDEEEHQPNPNEEEDEDEDDDE